MERDAIHITVRIDEVIFREFAIFDNLFRQRRWRAWLVFAGLMMGFALICFFMTDFTAGGLLLGTLLLVIGLGVPGVQILTFFSSLKKQCKAMGLDRPRDSYWLTLTRADDGIDIANPAGEKARYEWSALHAAYRVQGAVYLYILPNKAFLLPDGQADTDPDTLWAMVCEMLPKEKQFDRR